MPFAFLFGLYVLTNFVGIYRILIWNNCSGTFSTVFLYLVDVNKSRVECEEFIVAEMKRKAFDDAV